MSKVLYISYDGMTDPLGQSQVIPYLQGLSAAGYKITILSAEKSERYNNNKQLINDLLEKSGIEWMPILYTKWPPVFSTYYDVMRMQKIAIGLHNQNSFQIVHCRSYISALIGLYMKQRLGIKFIFDMRGFWADERVDGGLWKLSNPIYRYIFHYFKKKELQFLKSADYTISLTYNAKQEILSWNNFKAAPIPIEVIPCCADLSLFKPQPAEVRIAYRQKLNVANDEFLWIYVGSIGTWYLLDEMLAFYSTVRLKEQKMKILFLTTESASVIKPVLQKHSIPTTEVMILPTPRNEMPAYLSAGDGSIFFIVPSFSKKASSPVKHAETLGSHLLLVTNSNVGDVEKIVKESNTGVIVNDFSKIAYEVAYEEFKELKKSGNAQFDIALKNYYDLNDGINRYKQVYDKLS